jgi:hypothetical protein
VICVYGLLPSNALSKSVAIMVRIEDRPLCNLKEKIFLQELPIDGCIHPVALKVKYIGTKGVSCFYT